MIEHLGLLSIYTLKTEFQRSNTYKSQALAEWLSCAQAFWDPMTVAHQTSLYGVFQARILEWVAIFLLTLRSNLCLLYPLHCRQILYLLCHWESL